MFGIKKRLAYVRNILHPTITNNFIAKQLIEYYDGDSGHQTDAKTGNLGFGYVHYALIRNTKPARVLCVGSRKGYIPAICALACKDNRKGHVDFVDAGFGGDNKNHWSGIGWWKKIDPQKHFFFLGIHKYLTAYIMTTKEYALRNMDATYEYIYIDGDHSYKGAQLDYTLFWPKLSKCGFMVFHDVYVRHTKDLGYFGVWKLWKEIKNSNKIILPFPKESGLGILQKI